MINQANPVGAFLQGRGMAQQQQAQQQQMDLQRRQFGMQETQFNQGQQDRQREQQIELLADIGQAADWILAEPNEAPARLEQARAIYRPIFGDAVNNITLEQLPILRAQVQQELQGAVPAELRTYEQYLADLQSDDPRRRQAAAIALRIEAPPSAADISFREVKGPDGVMRLVTTNRRDSSVSAPNTSNPNYIEGRPEEESAGAIAREQTQARTDVERAAEIERLRPKARLTMQRAQGRANRVNELVQSILPRVSSMTAGYLGTRLAEWEGTAARDLQADIGTLQAIAGFDELGQLRAESPTGGALGQVSERELQFLQSVIANIEASQSPEQLRRNLERFNREVQSSWQRVQDAYEIDFGGGERPAPAPQPSGGQQNNEQNSDPLNIRGR